MCVCVLCVVCCVCVCVCVVCVCVCGCAVFVYIVHVCLGGGGMAYLYIHLQPKQEGLGLIPGGFPGLFPLPAGLRNVDGVKGLWCSSTVWLLSIQNMNGRVCGALVQFGCYHE